MNELFIYKGDMSFKTLNIYIAKILEHDEYNVLLMLCATNYSICH